MVTIVGNRSIYRSILHDIYFLSVSHKKGFLRQRWVSALHSTRCYALAFFLFIILTYDSRIILSIQMKYSKDSSFALSN